MTYSPNASTATAPNLLVALLSLYLLVLVGASGYAAYNSWPTAIAAKSVQPVEQAKGVTASPVSYTSTAEQEKGLVRFVMYLGILGACIHAMTSMATYIGNNTFRSSWTVWYCLRPLIGGVLAWIVFLVFRGGFLGGTQVEALNPYAFGALAAISGLFSKRVIDKLSELIDTMFRMPSGQGDDARANKLATGAISISSITPTTLSEADQTTELTIIGIGFVPGSVVDVAGTPLTPSSVKSDRVVVSVPVESFIGQSAVDLRVRAAGARSPVSNSVSVGVTK